MSERFFDDLARKLASPMPRQRALRLAAGAIVAAAVPGMRPGQAKAQSTVNADDAKCFQQYGAAAPVDCGGMSDGFHWCCRTGPDCCGNGACCNKDPNVKEVCRNNRCVPEACPSENKCGKDCCTDQEFCASPRRSLCCARGTDVCAATKAKTGLCCDPRKGEQCCFNETKAACCSRNQTCKGGTCTCKSGKPPCGKKCCEKGEVCSNGTCCPKGQVNCGDGTCCVPKNCCGKVCCNPNESLCINGTCCPPERIASRADHTGRCCPPGTIPVDSGLPDDACCPPSDPTCCGDPADSETSGQICPGKKTCVRGQCKSL